jgi:NodT family efflux transporter outer membrane factor (OMF) lipoprotein
MKRTLLSATGALALAGCVVGPNYESPAPNAPAQTPFAGAASPAFTGDEPPGRWWSLFEDPTLDALVEQALTANTDLRVAEANLRRARAALSETRIQALPTTDISASGTHARTPAIPGVPGGATEGDSYDVGFDVNYQLDLFGKIHRAIEASRADVGAVQAAFDLARITVAAETTRAYADACSAGRELAVANESARIQSEVYDLSRRLLEGGRATALETSQAGAQLDRTRAAIPALEAQRQSALYRLAVLTGRPPTDYPPAAAACETPPALARPIPVGNGASLLARRPDIRQAERNLAAATARIGVATADLYPSVTIGGSIGSTAGSVGDLGSSDSFRFSVGPLISWSFPNIFAARARIHEAEASADAALASFDGTWLNALRETESALTSYARERERLVALTRARDQGAEALRIARLRFDAGRESFQVVLDAETALAALDAELAQSEAQVSDNLVTLFLALGGGWQEPLPAVVSPPRATTTQPPGGTAGPDSRS